MRICFLGLSQNIASFARRLSRRIVAHQSRLLEGPDRLPIEVLETAIKNVNRARGLSPRRRRALIDIIQSATSSDAALEAISFFKSCSGGVCFSQGDLLPKETVALLADLKVIFRSVTGSNVRSGPSVPDMDDILYRPVWVPRSASPCSIPGASLLFDACGRLPR